MNTNLSKEINEKDKASSPMKKGGLSSIIGQPKKGLMNQLGGFGLEDDIGQLELGADFEFSL